MSRLPQYIVLFFVYIIFICCGLLSDVVSSHSAESTSAQAAFTASEIEFLQNHHIIKVQVAEGWPPYNFITGGKVKGYVNDYLRLLADKLDIELEFISGHSWSEYMLMLLTGEIDLISNMTITPERSKSYLFSEKPVFNVLNGLLTTRDNGKFADLEALRGKILAVVKGYGHEELLRHYYPDIPLLITDDLFDSMRQVNNGKADAAIGAHGVFTYLVGKHQTS